MWRKTILIMEDMLMKKNFFFLIISVIVFALAISLAFIFNYKDKTIINTSAVFVPYLIGKIIFTLALVCVTAWVYLTEKARGHGLILMSATYIAQLIPLALRMGIEMKGVSSTLISVYEILVLGFSLIIYIGFIALVFYQDKKMVASNHKCEGGTIEVVSEEEAKARNHK